MSEKLVKVDGTSVLDLNDSIFTFRSLLSEEEFIQMVLPMVKYLNAASVVKLMSESTTDEVSKIAKQIIRSDVRDEVALSFSDEYIVYELASQGLLGSGTLELLYDKFNSPIFLEVYSRSSNTDSVTLQKVYKDVIKKSIPNKWQILARLAQHQNNSLINKSLYEYACNVIENMFSIIKRVKDELSQKKYPESLKEALKKEKSYGAAVQEAGKAYHVLEGLASNYITDLEILHEVFEKYGIYSIHTLMNTQMKFNNYATALLGISLADTLGYRVLTNPSIEPEFRDMKFAEIEQERSSQFTSTNADGGETLYRIKTAKSAEGIWEFYKAWCKVEDEHSFLSLGHPEIKKILDVLGKNLLTPSDLAYDAILRVKEKSDKYYKGQYYYEYLGLLALLPNLDNAGFTLLVDMLESNQAWSESYFAECVKVVMIPLALHKDITEYASQEFYLMALSLDSVDGLEVICNLALNSKVIWLDDKFLRNSNWVVRRNFASRCVNLEYLEELSKDSVRDVRVVARRRLAEVRNFKMLGVGKDDSTGAVAATV